MIQLLLLLVLLLLLLSSSQGLSCIASLTQLRQLTLFNLMLDLNLVGPGPELLAALLLVQWLGVCVFYS